MHRTCRNINTKYAVCTLILMNLYFGYQFQKSSIFDLTLTHAVQKKPLQNDIYTEIDKSSYKAFIPNYAKIR